MTAAAVSIATTSLLGAYRTMVLIRAFEELCLRLHGTEIAGSIHPAAGQEAIAVGARLAVGERAKVVATYRGHHWALAFGVPPTALLAEIAGRESGVNGGRGGSPFLSAPEYGFIGENSIVGAGLPIANGIALASELTGHEAPVLVSFGDGATNQGAAHEAFVFAVARKLPVIFVCENNGWSEMTPIRATTQVSLAARASAYGMHAAAVDGNDAEAVATAVAEAAEHALADRGPVFLECETARLMGHYHADIEHYRSAEDRAAAVQVDPIPRLRSRLIELGHDPGAVDEEEAEARRQLDRAERDALAGEPARPATARDHVYRQPLSPEATAQRVGAASKLTYALAVNHALRREMHERPEVVVFGEDVALPGGVFGVTRNLHKEFGPRRVFDTPISEAAILGAAVGASMSGLRPIVEIMWSDFLLVALDQLVNQAANVSYLSRGSVGAPLVVRCQQGVTPGSCAQHSQSLEALIAHIPGLRVGLAATPDDAYAMTRAAVGNDDPCILIESRALYAVEGDVWLDAPVEQVGGARLRRPGDDVLVISWGRMAIVAIEAANRLESENVSVGILDLRWLSPLDRDAIAEAASGASRVLVLHEANLTGGFGAEVVATIVDRSFFDLDAPPVRLALPDVRIPAAPTLQQALVPTVETVESAVRDLLSR